MSFNLWVFIVGHAGRSKNLRIINKLHILKMRISKGKGKKLPFHSKAMHIENVDASEAFKVYFPRDIEQNVNGAFSLCDFLYAMVGHRKQITVCFLRNEC